MDNRRGVSTSHSFGWWLGTACVADMKSELSVLGKFLTDGPISLKDVSWAALKARARMGVQKDINQCIQLVEAYPDPEERVVGLLKDISYVRQPEVVESLRKYLNSEEKLRPLGQLIPSYAGYATRALAQMLVDFPGRKDIVSYSDEEIKRCRKWMSEQKEWKIIR